MSAVLQIATLENHQLHQFTRHAILFLFLLVSTILAVQTSSAMDGAPSMAELENATYTGIEDKPLTLTNGNWQGPPYLKGGASRPRAGLVKEFYLTGDLDGDGEHEAVALLWHTAGGTGSNIYIVVVGKGNNVVSNRATALVGDRVRVRQGEIKDGKIRLDVLQAGENDAMCCPGMLATRSWSLLGNRLEEGEIKVTGRLSIRE